MRIDLKGYSRGRLASPQAMNSRFREILFWAAALLPVIFVWGCAGVVSSPKTANTSPTVTYTISGAITPAAGGGGATVTLSGAASATATANGSGTYTFTGLANGTYTLTPSHAGYTFSPTNLSVTISSANVTTGLNFTATAVTNPTYSISGTISPTAGGSGATLTLSGAATTTTIANSAGNYTFTGLANGIYAVTPSHAGYTFSPTAQSATINGANVTGINFTATAQVGSTYSISGTISPTAGGSGATVLLSGVAAATTTTNSAGSYTFTGLSNGAYTVTPNNSGYTFSPVSQNVTVNAANLTGVNFTATAAQTHSVALTWGPSTSTVAGYNVYRLTGSGAVYTKINNSLITTLDYTDTTVQNATTYSYVATAVDSSGNESVYSSPASAQIP
ncbi:MAG: carboxypeptidase regulatory-like domain-containing protein [Candidatus Acidiferrum sp.]